MKITEQQKYRLKKFVKELGGYRGRHTELVSVYVPAGYDIVKILNHLSQEQGTATNIKSSSTRKNVIDSLEKMIQHLKLYSSTPLHGLAAFAGNTSEKEGQQDLNVWSIEPPVPLNIRIYRCDKQFVLEPLREMLEAKEAYGLVVMDRRDAHIALLKGKAIIPLVKTHSAVPGKTKAGGQSAHRFERLRDGAAKEFYKRIAEYIKEQFLGNKDLKGILVGGPGPTKYDFVDGNYITNEVKKKIIAIKDLSYTEEFGLQELVDKSQDVLADEEIAGEKSIVNKFFKLLSTKPNLVSYGLDDVKKNLERGTIDTLLLSEALDDDLVEELEIKAEELGTKVNIISTETREGAQLKEFGKIGAILRYEIAQ